MSAEQLRLVVEEEGRRVIAAQQAGAIPTAFTAQDCQVPDQPEQSRMYAGVDGMMVPLVTEAEQQKRRENIVKKRRELAVKGRELKPLPVRKPGSDLPYKEFQTVTFYDQENAHRHIVLARTKRTSVGAVLKREVARLKSDQLPGIRGKGRDIGSGPMEARCKTSTSLLKCSSQRWTGPHAEAIAALTNLRDSGQWQIYWQTPSRAKT